MSTSAVTPEPAVPMVVHNCPNCSHWLPDGTLACPDCQTLTYGQHLSDLAHAAQQLEAQQKWAEARNNWQEALLWLPAETRQAVSIQQHLQQLDARLQGEVDKKAKWTKRLGPLAPVMLFLAKFKSAFFLLFKLKFLFSLFAYVGIYWALFGWQFAVALAGSVFLHEMGHYAAAKIRGLKVDLPMFLPGFGAYVQWYGQGVSQKDIAAIALAGPVAGMGVALLSYGIFLGTHQVHPFFLMAAYVGAYINFLNLFAVRFAFLALDGAQAAFDLTMVQRGLIAATCLLFFGLTVNAAGGDFQARGCIGCS